MIDTDTCEANFSFN